MKNTGTLKVVARGELEIVMTRVFDAPRALVFEAMSRPELLKRWFGPHGHQLVECEVDLRVGGAWRYLIAMPGGRTMGMSGEYLELSPPDRTVHTERFDDFPGQSIVTTLLTEENGRTTLTATVLAELKEIRDAVIASGMEHGAAESYDRLAEFLAGAAARTAADQGAA